LMTASMKSVIYCRVWVMPGIRFSALN